MKQSVDINLAAGNGHAQIHCAARRQRRLGRVAVDGVYIWCNDCHSDHFVAWEDLVCFLRAIKEAAGEKVVILTQVG